MMSKHVFHLGRRDARQRERRKIILLKETDTACFQGIYGFTAANLAQKEELVDVVWHGGMPVLISVIQCCQLFDHHVVARFFLNFANSCGARSVTDVCPTAWHSPKLVLPLFHKQYPFSVKNCRADIDFRCSISDFSL